MQIDDALIDKLSALCKLSFEAQDREAIKADLQRMLDFVEKIAEVDTTGVAPLIHMTKAVNVWREDVVQPTLTHEQALANAPKRDSDYFRVPKVIKG
jgi:aspartyl-tRNA(Asn)/glutamyl-tRNA(Gln) amidotransferase subunit C